MVIRINDKNQNYNNVTKLLVKPTIISLSQEKPIKSYKTIKMGTFHLPSLIYISI